MSFSEMLKAKIGNASLVDVATTLGLALPGLRKAVAGRSVPNARSVAKYAAFLGISEAETKALIVTAKATAPARANAKGKPGRKAKVAKAEKSEAAAKPGRKPKGKPGRKPGRKANTAASSSDLGKSLDLIKEAITKAEAILADPLVNMLYTLEGAKRKAAEAILASVM